jgi:hypothetical protein
MRALIVQIYADTCCPQNHRLTKPRIGAAEIHISQLPLLPRNKCFIRERAFDPSLIDYRVSRFRAHLEDCYPLKNVNTSAL